MYMKKPLLTVSVITYNHASYIAKCLETLLAQKTDFDYFIRIFDDCSTDGTTDICRKYAEEHPDRIKLFTNEKNLGAVENPIKAYSNIETPYYMLIEGDDYICDETRFQQQIDILETYPECSFCAGNTQTHFVKENKDVGVFPVLETGIYTLEYAKKFPFVSLQTHSGTRIGRTRCITLDKRHPDIFLRDITQTFELLRQGPMYYVDKTWCVYNFTRNGIWSGLTVFNKVRFLLDNIDEYNSYTGNELKTPLVETFRRHASFDLDLETLCFQTSKKAPEQPRQKKKRFKKVVHFFIPPCIRSIFYIPRNVYRFLCFFFRAPQNETGNIFISGNKVVVFTDDIRKYQFVNSVAVALFMKKPFKIRKTVESPAGDPTLLPFEEIFSKRIFPQALINGLCLLMRMPKPYHFKKKPTDASLIIFDSLFPLRNSGFRYFEYDAYIRHFKSISVVTDGKDMHFACNGDDDTLLNRKNIVQDYNDEFGTEKVFYGDFSDYDIHTASLVYCVFLGRIYKLLTLDNLKTPFVFTLYPGGDFSLNQEQSDAMLRTVFSSPYFRRVIVTHKITRDYLLEKGLCPAEKMSFIFGGVVPPYLSKADFLKDKQYYGRDKDVMDICFVATKYTEFGQDKGYDTFIDAAKKIYRHHKNVRFHVVGNGFDEHTLDVSEIRDVLCFYGFMKTTAFDHFYRDKDFIVSPNKPFVLDPGFFDGFPTGCVSEAMLHCVAAIATDELGLNLGHYENHRDIELISPSADEIVMLIEKYLEKPELIPVLALNGKERTKEWAAAEHQIAPRIKVLEEVLQKEGVSI